MSHRNILSRLTFDPGDDNGGIWSPDGSQIVFNSMRAGVVALRTVTAGGTGGDEVVFRAERPIPHFPTDWSRDGRHVAFVEGAPPTTDIWVLPMFGDRKPIAFAEHRVRRGRSVLFSRWPMARLLVERIRSAAGVRAAVPANRPQVPRVAEWRRPTAVESGRARTVLSGSRRDDQCRRRDRGGHSSKAAFPHGSSTLRWRPTFRAVVNTRSPETASSSCSLRRPRPLSRPRSWWSPTGGPIADAAYFLATTPRTAPAIMRLSAAIDSPPSSVGGIVAKPIADAFG